MLKAYWNSERIEAGCDEAGRGCLAGPVYAAAVILPKGFEHPLLNDSKQVRPEDRLILREYIEEHALAYAVCSADRERIDRHNIYRASFYAMHQAISQLQIRPQLLLIDGNTFPPYQGIAHQCFVKGDARFLSIAAASILAKTYRDEKMLEMHREFPHYGWDFNKGYATRHHREAILKHGICKYHRTSFRLYPENPPRELFSS